MRAATLRSLLLACACFVSSCGDDADEPQPQPSDATVDTGVPSTDSDVPDSSPGDAADGGLSHCLERPTDLPSPPTGALPCELIPPGLTL